MEEKQFLQDRGLLVTSSRIEIDGQTFAVRNVGSVKLTTAGRPWLAIMLAIPAPVLLSNTDTRAAGALLLALALFLGWRKWRTRNLVLVSGGGEIVALASRNHARMHALRNAVAAAISAR